VCARGWELDRKAVGPIALLRLLVPARPGPSKTAACMWAAAAATDLRHRGCLNAALCASVSAELAASETQREALEPLVQLSCLVMYVAG
jgi:hypothetical protein